jgi:DNA-binding NarL/FixJ family response regulator
MPDNQGVPSEWLVVVAELEPGLVAWILAGMLVMLLITLIPRMLVASGPKKVVLVDDDPDVLRGLRWLIEDRTALTVVGEARTGRSAVQVVDSTQPDVVVIDVKLPDLDGIEATRKIRAAHPEVRVVSYSSPEDDATGSIMRRAGASAQLVKGDSPETIVRTISELA